MGYNLYIFSWLGYYHFSEVDNQVVSFRCNYKSIRMTDIRYYSASLDAKPLTKLMKRKAEIGWHPENRKGRGSDEINAYKFDIP